MDSSTRRKKNAGFTLIETLVALAVLVTAVTSMIALISHGLSGVRTSKNRLIALNLAQEGLELVRVVREHNKMCDQWDDDQLNDSFPWDRETDSDGIKDLKKTNQIVDATDWPATDRVTCKAGVILQNPNFSGPPCNTKIKLDANGRYGYLTGTNTIFQRCIDIKNPPGPPEDDIPTNDMLNVVSTVSWIERGVTQSVVLREQFYNWK